VIETDVLIVGSGPAGSSSALFLSTYGVDNLVITKYRWTANTPRAHITNQRAVEIMRDMGLEDEIKAKGVPNHLMGDTVFCASLAGDELARLHTWGTHPERLADYTLASPCTHYDLPQDILEPIILGEAARRGSRVRFDTEYLSHTQDAEGVTVQVQDRVGGERYAIRAKYLIGADGGRSKIAQDIGLPMEGEMDWAGSMNIVFHADLSRYVAHRPSVLYWIMQPGADMGGIGMGLVRMVRPWDEWLIVWGYDIKDPPPEVDEEVATRVVHNLVGDDTIEVKLRSTSLWGNNKMYAKRYVEGRVFCMGDACHRHPPSNGLGSNTSIADAYNLAWKLALVLDGKAAPSLLDSYDAERAPIGKQIVLRANQSIEEFGPIFEALGDDMEVRKENSPRGAESRAKLKAAIELKNYEFNAHGVELGHRAVLPPDDVARRASPARVGPAPGREGLDARSRGQGSLHALHRDRRRRVARSGRGRDGAYRRADGRADDRAGARRSRHLRRLGAGARGRGNRLRAGPSRRARGMAQRGVGRRPRRGARAGDGEPAGCGVRRRQ
jgi:2,4-dichlorophenol 6-monooxygenase